ncbi:BppU family phage baseplate upper protein [Bacillus paranthracis]|uniref:BppU family phage baseplate upper protein n=2 Tax=Bacillus cereus group TaxID=86661 RepID=UPI001D0D09AA|nr:BppU family phage baseplate upper protein [Bacillus paranthracis]
MNNQSYEITVDTRKSISHSNIEFSQNNLNISELIFNITEDGTNFTLNDTDKIIVYFEKPDKTVVFQDKEVELLDKEKGKIKVLLTSQTLVKAGDVKGQISIERIEDGTRKRVNTYDFSFKVRSSIASNDSIESTNEFQIFDKIMVAGEKFKDFEDEDFDELIAAGELAKGALPKSGGTMTGNIDMDTSVGSKSKGYRWRDKDGALFGLETSTTGELILYDYKAAARVWQYDPVAKRFNVNSDTNLLKTNQIYTGWLHSIGTTKQLREGDDLNNIQDSGIYGGPKLLNAPNPDYLYVEVVKYNDANYVLQRATTLTGSNLGTWVRRKTGSIWGAWVQIIDATGGSIKGTMIMESGDFRFKNAANDVLLRNNTSGIFSFFDIAQNQVIWTYNPTTKEFNVNSPTNLLKKSGDTMVGDLRMALGKIHRFQNSDDKSVAAISVDNNGRWYNWSDVSAKRVFMYDPTTDTFTIDSANTNLFKKTGDTMTGTLKMGINAIIQQEQHKRNANAKGIFYTDEGSATTVAGVGRYVSDTGDDFMYVGHGSSPWSSTAGLRVSPTFLTYKGKDVKTADKDGRADLVLTADATNFDTSRPPVAVRRGNTVTIRGAIGVSASATANLVTTLPTDMRPIDSLTQTILTNDGSATTLELYPDGRVILSNSAKGKNIYIVFTYVVN